jgi:orotate phosphoribosyltransferase
VINNNLAGQLVLLILAGSSLVVILDAVGFLPDRISRWVNRKRLTFSLDLLRELGLIPQDSKRIVYSVASEREAAQREITQATIRKPVTVGRTENARFSHFVDIMGVCTNPATATRIARILSTHARRTRALFGKDGQPRFDAVACPKSGSPILAYEFAKIVDKPLILFPDQPKFEDPTSDPHGRLDYDDAAHRTDHGRALLLDDSTTGGRQMLNLAHALRQFGWDVGDCLVLFEPLGKGARQRLKENGIRLHAVVDGPRADG